MVIATVIAVLVTPILLYLLFAKWRHQYWARKGVPQFDSSLLFGEFKPIILGTKSIKDIYLDIYRRAKNAGLKHVGVYNTIIPDFVPCDLDLIKQILVRDFHNFSSHGTRNHKNDPLTTHLFNLEGAQWKDRRVKLTPIFTTGKMKVMFDTVAAKSTGLKGVMEKHIAENQPVDIKDVLARFTTDVIGAVAFGLDCDTLKEPDHEFRQLGRVALKPRRRRIVLGLLVPRNVLVKLGYHSQAREVISYFTRIVKDTIKYRETSDVKRKDFLQLMIQLKNQGTVGTDDNLFETIKGKNFVTEEDIINEAFLFYVAGFETSSSTMTFAFLELAQAPEIQDKLRKEIVDVLEKHGGNITYDSLVEMDYLDKVVKETLRKYPVVPALPRKCTTEYKIKDSNIVIDKGTKVTIPIIGLHMDPDYYPNPEQFNPENFSPENRAKRPEIAWIPFGEGPRQCIGLRFGVMQAKIGIAALLKDFSFTLDKTMKPPYIANPGSFIYALKNNVMLRATKI